MACKLRIRYPGAFYHVMLCGNGGQDIFFSDADHSRFHFLLQEGGERYNHRIHAFCQMTNHVHLAIQVGNIPLSRIMENVSFHYTRYIVNIRVGKKISLPRAINVWVVPYIRSLRLPAHSDRRSVLLLLEPA